MQKRYHEVFLGSGYLHIDEEDMSVVRIKQGQNAGTYEPGIHVPVGIMHVFGDLRVMPMETRRGYLVGDRFSLGEGAIVPCNKGIRIYERENPQRSRLNITLIRSLARAGVRVKMTFRIDINLK